MKTIIISQRVDYIEDRGETRDCIDQRLIEFAVCCGFSPFPVPNNLVCIDSWLKKIQPNGVILSGGNNVGEYSNRDMTERRLLNYANDNNLPVLGICRGMQFMAIEYGAELSKATCHVRNSHHITGEINGIVNSFHDYKVNICPKGFRVTAQSTFDNSIEAIKHEKFPWEGWMWHPERNDPFQTNDIIRFKELFS